MQLLYAPVVVLYEEGQPPSFDFETMVERDGRHTHRWLYFCLTFAVFPTTNNSSRATTTQ